MVKDRAVVIPGQLLGKDQKGGYSPNYFKEKGKLFSSVMGMVRKKRRGVKVIPSKGTYIPKERDVVIGVVEEAHRNRWHLDINSPYECIIFERALSQEKDRREREPPHFNVGDILSVKISRVDEVNFCEAIKPWKLEKSLILEVNPRRVPRVIGRKRSMLNLIKKKTNSKIIVGQNGRIWIKGSRNELVVKVIKKIIREAQTQGLTNRIKNMLEKEIKENG